MSLAQPACRSSGSTDSPMIFTPRRSNSGLMLAMYPSSVVQTGVKSFGWENSTPHESPSQSWKRIGPSVVSASKSGAVSPSCRAIVSFLSPLRPKRVGHSRLPDLCVSRRRDSTQSAERLAQGHDVADHDESRGGEAVRGGAERAK